VGSGTRFFSGISVYTVSLANAFAASRPVSIITMRQLLPTRLYPGRARVGTPLADLTTDPRVVVLDGIDWYWIPSLLRAITFLLRHRPAVMVMQWWTGSVLHTYVVLALVARLLGIRVIIEVHEILDTGEARLRGVRGYVGVLAPVLFRLATAFTVHSRFDEGLVRDRYRLGKRPVVVVPHAPYDHVHNAPYAQRLPASRAAPSEACNLLFFGVIRPYKGLENLIAAFDSVPPDQIAGYWLTVVGETWEGWELPATLIRQSRYRERITFVNRYVHDRELDAFLRGSDAVVLPYVRSSLSGPLHVAMGYGLPVVISDVGGNPEAVEGYQGVILTAPSDPSALRDALTRVAALRGQRFEHPKDWTQTTRAYEDLFERIGVEGNPSSPPLRRLHLLRHRTARNAHQRVPRTAQQEGRPGQQAGPRVPEGPQGPRDAGRHRDARRHRLHRRHRLGRGPRRRTR
jgi:glycosyltransferase involved in cell wall biosynthesis